MTHHFTSSSTIVNTETGEQVLNPIMLSRRELLKTGSLALAGLALPTVLKAESGASFAEITKEDIVIPNLSPEFDGMTVTLASDFHSSDSMSPQDLKRIVRQMNDLKSDMILLPGDFVTSKPAEFPPIMEAFSDLRAPQGIYASTGNHDYDADVDIVSSGLEEIGIKMLRNDNHVINKNGEKLYLLGLDDHASNTVDDYIEGKSAPELEAMFKGVPNDVASIFLCHRPYNFEEFAQTDIGLMVSGHTHGGQIVLARFGRSVVSLCSLASNFVDGLYEQIAGKHRVQMYVSRGLGVVDIPFRLNCPPEITQITLRSPALAVNQKVVTTTNTN
jgi:predicted MPP superfamily phosphohydrolase